MTKELFRICTGENHHKFGAEGGFKEIEICPYCQTHMDLVELTIDAKGIPLISGLTIASI